MNNTVKGMVTELKLERVTKKQILAELEYRDNSNNRWDDDLFEFDDNELEDVLDAWDN